MDNPFINQSITNQPKLGGHTCIIKNVVEKKSRAGRDMIEVDLDFDESDMQSGYFAEMSEQNQRRWPFQGRKYILVRDYNHPDRVNPAFRSFIAAYEKSNGEKVVWGGDNWGGQFVGKKIGVVYGNVQSSYQGFVEIRPEPRWFCSITDVSKQKIPKDKFLKGYST